MFGLCAVLSVRGDLISFYRKLCYAFCLLCHYVLLCPMFDAQWFVIWRCFVLCLVSFSGVSLFSPNRLDAAHSVSFRGSHVPSVVCFVLSVAGLVCAWRRPSVLCLVVRSQCIFMRWFRARPRSKQPLTVCYYSLSMLLLCKLFELFTLPVGCVTLYSHVLSDLSVLPRWSMSDASLNAKKLKS